MDVAIPRKRFELFESQEHCQQLVLSLELQTPMAIMPSWMAPHPDWLASVVMNFMERISPILIP